MLTYTGRRRSMPSSRFSRPSLPLPQYTHLGMLSRSAALSLMPIQKRRRLIMPRLQVRAFGQAHLFRALARLALSGAACFRIPAALAQPVHPADAARGERDRGDFTRWYLLQSHRDLSWRRG